MIILMEHTSRSNHWVVLLKVVHL